MKILVKAKPNSKQDKVIPPQPRLIPGEEDFYIVYTKEKPVDGKANMAITKLLAEHFSIPRSAVQLISGATSKKKVFKIDYDEANPKKGSK